jgi:hypothetical protein
MRARPALACALALLPLLAGTPARASDGADGSDAADKRGLYLELPLIDLPANVRHGFSAPSMQQSLWIATDVYQLAHFGIGEALDPYEGPWWSRLLGRVAIAAADVALLPLPGGLAWQHEEWHRAALSNRQASSSNDVYRFRVFDSLVNVSHVADADLERFKAEHPAEFVRMQTAGIEANYELATNVEKTQFFYQTRTWNAPLLWQLYLVNSAYLGTCASSRADRLTDDANAEEAGHPERRDFTGLDCTGWTYDLFRPTEPFAARGRLADGSIDRYRKNSALTPDEQGYLRRTFYLSLLNFIDPALLGVDALTIKTSRGAPWRWNFHVRHTPTSFGSAADLDVLMQRSDYNFFLTLHSYFNRSHYFPGVTAEVLRFPLDLVVGLPVSASARLGAWLQPKDQGFETASMRPGGLAALRLGYGATRQVEPYVEVEAKSEGWVAGSVFLTPNVSGRLGLVAPLL